MNPLYLINSVYDAFEQYDDIAGAVDAITKQYNKEFVVSDIRICELNYDAQQLRVLYSMKDENTKEDCDACENRMSIAFNNRQQNELNNMYKGKNYILYEGEEVGECESIMGFISGKPGRRALMYPSFRNERLTGVFAFIIEKTTPINDGQIELFRILARIAGSFSDKMYSDANSRMKTEFLSKMSHEIRTPMNAIIGMTNIALSSLGDINRVEDCLNKIDLSTKFLLSLVNNILDMSKIESGKMTLSLESLDMDDVITSIEQLMAPQVEAKGITLRVLKEYKHKYILADELKLSQILMNLVGNAVKYTMTGGRIILRVEEMLDEDDSVVMKFYVMDNGIGIDSKNLDRIFEAFEQAEADSASRFGGTGLGLSISNNLVQLMGGSLKVESTLDKGSVFYFTLSFKKCNSKSGSAVAKKDAESVESFDFNGYRVLIVEDNELNAEIAQTVMEMVGFTTELAENGKLAVDMYTSHEAGYYDCVLMDIRMPVMDGLEATGHIRASGRRDAGVLPIIAMTANAFDEDMKKSINSGMNGHLSKPIDTKLLYREVARLIRERDGKESR